MFRDHFPLSHESDIWTQMDVKSEEYKYLRMEKAETQT